jgi:hypothetical protein
MGVLDFGSVWSAYLSILAPCSKLLCRVYIEDYLGASIGLI